MVFIVETSWEVCNKVGGIYTVLSSKAAVVQEQYMNYLLIGPYIPSAVKTEFTSLDTPVHFEKVFVQLQQEGVVCYYGQWEVSGKPKVILLDFQGFIKHKDVLKKYYWDTYQIDSLFSGWDFEEPLLWSSAVARLVTLLAGVVHDSFILHCHEWLAGFALLSLRSHHVPVSTVFTTHATMLGRSVAGAGQPLYDMLHTFIPEEKAKELHVYDKFCVERACALTADVFTTVSDITALEAEAFFGRKPDVLLYNGLDINQFPSFEETSIKHQESRELIRQFIAYYFFPYYYFDLEESLTFFIVGRYEFSNKGIDLFIKALAQLDKKLQEEKSKKTIIVFFWIPTQVFKAKQSVAESKINYHRMVHYLESYQSTFHERLMDNIMVCSTSSCFINEDSFVRQRLFDDEFLQTIKKLRLTFLQDGSPPLVTHDITDEHNDAILSSLRLYGLVNTPENKVKCIFYPVYLTGVDGLIDLPYYQAIAGCHLGLFPSYYEPWGYTPLEAAAWGVPSLTTDLGGFGRFLLEHYQEKKQSGIYVLERYQRQEDAVVASFATILYDFVQLNRKGRVQEKIAAKKLSQLADWNVLIKGYVQAYDLAVKKHG